MYICKYACTGRTFWFEVMWFMLFCHTSESIYLYIHVFVCMLVQAQWRVGVGIYTRIYISMHESAKKQKNLMKIVFFFFGSMPFLCEFIPIKTIASNECISTIHVLYAKLYNASSLTSKFMCILQYMYIQIQGAFFRDINVFFLSTTIFFAFITFRTRKSETTWG